MAEILTGISLKLRLKLRLSLNLNVGLGLGLGLIHLAIHSAILGKDRL